MNQLDMQNYILDSIDIMIKERFKEMIKSNYYIEAMILTDNEDGTYNIEFNEQELKNVKSRNDLVLNTGDIVLVCVINGDFSRKFIDLIRP